MKPAGSLPERVRPRVFSDICGFTEVVQRLEQLEECLGFVGNSFFLVGKSGVGKTTIARIIASKVADPTAITEIDAQDLTLEKDVAFDIAAAEHHGEDADRWRTLAAECVADMPVIEIE